MEDMFSVNVSDFTLADTESLMESIDYKERFLAEYIQIAIRCHKLEAMMDKWVNGELTFSPTCGYSMYRVQVAIMQGYMHVLEERAEKEFDEPLQSVLNELDIRIHHK